MSDSPSLPTAFGIEAVEWSQRGESLTVQVTGRWRRRRPLSPGQPLLVLEAEGRRHRFPAMPEPPGLTGAAPGTWQMSFTIPAELAPGPGSSAWLQIGAVVIPLPVALASQPPASEPIPQLESEAQPPARRTPGPELALEAARAEVRDVQAKVERLTEELQDVRQELEHARELARVRDIARRRAEQQAYAESERREELQEELGRLLDAVGSEAEAQRALSDAQERVRDLEDETEWLRQALDEAEQAAAAAEAARERAERGRSTGVRVPAAGPTALAGEQELALRALERPPRGSVPRLRRPHSDTQALALERRLLTTALGHPPPRADEAAAPAQDATRLRTILRAAREEVTELRSLTEREREARRVAEARVAALEARLVDSEAQLVDAERRSQLAFSAIEELREELGLVRGSAPMATVVAPPPSPAPAAPPAPDLPAAPAVDPQRLDQALSRLREPPPEAEAAAGRAESEADDAAAAGAAKPWLKLALRTLADEDPVTAGRLVVALLPAQRAIHPYPLRYDLVLGPAQCLHVTAMGEASPVTVRVAEAERQSEFVEFSVHGDLAALGRLVASGSARRRIGGRRARIRGDRVAARALLALATAPLSLRRLLQLGVRLEPWVAAALVARMIEPEWTRGYRFGVAFPADAPAVGGALLHVSDGRRPTALPLVSGALEDAAVIVPAEGLTAFLRGDSGTAGAAEPAALLQRWIQRAQSG